MLSIVFRRARLRVSRKRVHARLNIDHDENVAIASPPPDLPKIGDDQIGFSVGFVTSFMAIKGDAYVESSIAGFTPDGTSRWQALTELARRVLAAH